MLEEEGFVMRVFSNGFVVFVPRFGIEGLIRVKDVAAKEEDAVFKEDEYKLEIKMAPKTLNVELFAKIMVRIKDEVEPSTGKRKLKIDLVG